jgi:excisionase family DNA binding protein
VSWPTLRQLIVDQGIPHVRLGRRWKIEVAVLDDHLRQLANSTAFAR